MRRGSLRAMRRGSLRLASQVVPVCGDLSPSLGRASQRLSGARPTAAALAAVLGVLTLPLASGCSASRQKGQQGSASHYLAHRELSSASSLAQRSQHEHSAPWHGQIAIPSL
jgi:hypothetical protein